MKLLTTITQNFKNIMIGVLIVFALILLNKCRQGKDENAELKGQLATLKQEKKQSEKSLDSISKKHKADSAELKGREQLAVIEKQEADKMVSQQQKTIDRLAAIVRNTTGKPVDSSFVLVSPEFKEACDSLPEEIAKLNRAIAERDTAIDAWTDILGYEVQQRDSTIQALQLEVNKLDRMYKGAETIAETLLARSKPRGMFLLGVGIMGNQSKILGGASLKAAYLTKGGKMYQYSPHVLNLPGMVSPAVYHEVGIFVRPFK